MADKSLTFSRESVQRIANVVRTVEGQGTPSVVNGTGEPKRQNTFNARLTGEGTGTKLGYYKWSAVYMKDGQWVPASPAVTSGENFSASSYNRAYSLLSKNPGGLVVELKFMGYDPEMKPVYKFVDTLETSAVQVKVSSVDGGGSYGVAKRVEAGQTTGDDIYVALIHHTLPGSTFYAYPLSGSEPGGYSYVQIGYPAPKGKFKVLQMMDDSASPNAIDWDGWKVME